jgi:hypothetical protein
MTATDALIRRQGRSPFWRLRWTIINWVFRWCSRWIIRQDGWRRHEAMRMMRLSYYNGAIRRVA